jgi:hypothetical protein
MDRGEFEEILEFVNVRDVETPPAGGGFVGNVFFFWRASRC